MDDVQAWSGGLAGNRGTGAFFAVALDICYAKYHGKVYAGSCKQGIGKNRWILVCVGILWDNAIVAILSAMAGDEYAGV